MTPRMQRAWSALRHSFSRREATPNRPLQMLKGREIVTGTRHSDNCKTGLQNRAFLPMSPAWKIQIEQALNCEKKAAEFQAFLDSAALRYGEFVPTAIIGT